MSNTCSIGSHLLFVERGFGGINGGGSGGGGCGSGQCNGDSSKIVSATLTAAWATAAVVAVVIVRTEATVAIQSMMELEDSDLSSGGQTSVALKR